jgi:hypothetical protein
LLFAEILAMPLFNDFGLLPLSCDISLNTCPFDLILESFEIIFDAQDAHRLVQACTSAHKKIVGILMHHDQNCT